MARGTKKTVEALEQKFETQKKPVEQDFFDLLASFYHKDEDLAFLISLSKATVTDVEAGEDHTRFMTALRTYQAIQFWVRLSKLENLYTDVNNLIMQRINEMWSQLLATDDTDTIIDTLGEVFLAFQNYQEVASGIKNNFDFLYSILQDLSGARVVKNTFENHHSRIGNIESRMQDVPNTPRQVQNTFDSLFSLLRDMSGDRVIKNNFDFLYSILQDLSGARVVKNTFENHDSRIGNIESRMQDVPNTPRQVQNTFDSLFSLLRDMSGDRVIKNNFDFLYSILQDLSGARVVKNTFDNHNGRINQAQNDANNANGRIGSWAFGEITITTMFTNQGYLLAQHTNSINNLSAILNNLIAIVNGHTQSIAANTASIQDIYSRI